MQTSTEKSLSLGTAIQYVPGVGPRRARLFEKLEVCTAGDLLFCFPRDYEYPSACMKIAQLRAEQSATVVGTVIEVTHRVSAAGRSVVGVLIEDETGPLRAVFFNQPYRREQLPRDTRVMLTGVPKQTGVWMEMRQPKVARLGEDEELPAHGILPIYPLTEGLRQAEVRAAARHVAAGLATAIPEVLPECLRGELGGLLPVEEALQEIHLPTSQPRLEAARQRFVVQELFVLQLALALKRRRVTTELHSPPLEIDAKTDARIRRLFPFTFTSEQDRVIEEMCGDLRRQFPMNRLLQGDVGSGKTVIALYAMLLCTARGYQSVLMAPTEVLARQHYVTLQSALSASRVRLGLLTGGGSPGARRETCQRVARGEIDVLVGTQALIAGQVQFHKLGLVVIDEQHKFGVAQRAALRQAGVDPHCLVMTATPIPRTMAMTQFGDLDVSTLRDAPPGRGEVHTYLAEDGWRNRWWQFVAKRLNEGRQGYVVAPRVGAEQQEDTSSVTSVFQSLRSGPLAGFRLGLLHGRMSTDEKRAVMASFARGEIQVLVATTVIEVGIDVPNATTMTILGGQAFGLAQLHQLRGRVTRGGHTGYVCVFTDGESSPEEVERLRLFASTTDGFELAEADFRLRGAGDLLGKRQSGSVPLRVADPARDMDALLLARRVAQEIVDRSPELDEADLQGLRGQVVRRYGERLELGDIG